MWPKGHARSTYLLPETRITRLQSQGSEKPDTQAPVTFHTGSPSLVDQRALLFAQTPPCSHRTASETLRESRIGFCPQSLDEKGPDQGYRVAAQIPSPRHSPPCPRGFLRHSRPPRCGEHSMAIRSPWWFSGPSSLRSLGMRPQATHAQAGQVRAGGCLTQARPSRGRCSS